MSKLRILIVEDEPVISMVLKNRLTKLGYEVTGVVSTGEEAIALVHESVPDLVLVDIKLEGRLDGIEAATQLRSLFRVPIVYVTAYTDPTLLERAKLTEPVGYLVKPYGERELLSTVEMALYKDRIERQLRESEERFRKLTEVAPYGLSVISEDDTFEYFNPKFTEIFGYTKQDLPDLDSWFLNAHPDEPYRKHVQSIWKQDNVDKHACGEIEPRLFSVRCKDGIEKISSFRVVVVEDGKRIVTYQDVTTEVKAREEIVRARNEWERTFDAVPDQIMILDSLHRIVRANRAAAVGLKITPEEAVGLTCHKVVHGTDSPPPACPFSKMMADGKEHSAEVILEKPGGVFEIKVSPFYDSEGNLIGGIHAARDITHRKKAEKLLVHSERLKAVGALASGVAHNFNNLLQVVVGGAQLASLGIITGDLSDVKGHIDQILESARSGSETVKRLQSFARRGGGGGSMPRKVFDLSHLIRQAIETTSILWDAPRQESGIVINMVQVLEQDSTVHGNENELFEVAVNLIKNAVEALPHGGEIRVETFLKEDNVILQVRDTGVGIPQADLGMVFEPFFTTKGFLTAGMGLSSCYGIVKGHGGTITVESELDCGAVFSVTLPFVKDRQDTVEAVGDRVLGDRLRILVIDNLEPLVVSLDDGLTQFGQEVRSALSGREGLQIFEKQPFDAVVCDLGMPGMNGWEVAEKIERICDNRGVPRTPFILLAGWSDLFDDEEVLSGAGVDAVVSKPVEIANLFEIVRKIVRQRAEKKE